MPLIALMLSTHVLLTLPTTSKPTTIIILQATGSSIYHYKGIETAKNGARVTCKDNISDQCDKYEGKVRSFTHQSSGCTYGEDKAGEGWLCEATCRAECHYKATK